MPRLGKKAPARERLDADAQHGVYTPPAPRPAIVADGVEFEPVWFPHRDAKWLLPDDYPSTDGNRGGRFARFRRHKSGSESEDDHGITQ